MRSLFVKIIGLCVLVMLTSFFANGYIRLFTMGVDKPHLDSFATLLTVEMDESRAAWESGGKPALAATLARLKKNGGFDEAHFTDANGVDLVTGENRSNLVSNATHRAWNSHSGGSINSFARVSPDHRYWYFQRGGQNLFKQPEWQYRLLAMALAALPAYALSWWLAMPLMRLQRAMKKFGDGDLSARADPRRRDEFGDLARVFNKMADRIQMLLDAEKRLFQDVSHELRTPLTRLQVAIEIARSRGSNRLLDQIQEESERLEALIGQLMEMAKAEGDAVQNKVETLRLDLLATRVVDACEIEAEARGCALVLNVDAAVALRGTSELLHRTLENIVRNAIRFSPPGSAIEVGVDRLDGGARITVRDFGPGVREESLGRLFDAFYREPRNRDDNSGLGLGLAIARRAIELHGGRIEAANARPGLRVTMTFPVVSEAVFQPPSDMARR